MNIATYNILKGGSQRVHWVRLIENYAVDFLLVQESYAPHEHLPPLLYPNARSLSAWQMIEQYGDMVSHILFASDYPHWDSDNPDMALPTFLPEAVKQAIYYDNARKLHNLPAAPGANGHTGSLDDSHLERV